MVTSCAYLQFVYQEACFFINGVLDSEISFAGAQLFPMARILRARPMDSLEEAATRGMLDDFRVYGVATMEEIGRLHGAGMGDFDRRTIEFAYSDNLEIPKPIEIRFLQDGFPVNLESTSPGSFELSDLIETSAPFKIYKKSKMAFIVLKLFQMIIPHLKISVSVLLVRK